MRPQTRQNDTTLDRRTRHFGPSKFTLAIVLAVAFFATMIVYSVALNTSYKGVVAGVRDANVFYTTLSTISPYPIGNSGSNFRNNIGLIEKLPLDEAALFEILKAWRVVDRGMTLKRLMGGGKDVTAEAKLLTDIKSCSTEPLAKTKTVDILMCLLGEFGGGNQNSFMGGEGCLKEGVVYAIAGVPGAGPELEAKVVQRLLSRDQKASGAKGPIDPKVKPAAAEEKSCPLSRRVPLWLPFEWGPAQRADDAAIIRSMLLASGVIRLNTHASPPTSNWTEFEPKRKLFLEEAVSRIRTDPSVKDENFWITLWRGPEQFFIIFTGTALLLLIAQRLIQRKILQSEATIVFKVLSLETQKIEKEPLDKRPILARDLADRIESAAQRKDSYHIFPMKTPTPVLWAVAPGSLALYMAEKAIRRVVIVPSQPELFRLFCDGINSDVEKSGWLLRYAARALPAIGFIGTVRGIMVALQSADGIFGTTGPQQLSAMTAVTDGLGLAFATTLIALIAGLITSLAGDWEIAKEQELLARMEDGLIEIIDPAER